jgi:hypothetical protein
VDLGDRVFHLDVVQGMKESTVEAYLVDRAKIAGAEVRKVKWGNRVAAPDRVLMRRPAYRWQPATIWIEVKRPGGKAKFPCDARERAQAREHKRMRDAGQVVVIVDCYEDVDALFR